MSDSLLERFGLFSFRTQITFSLCRFQTRQRRGRSWGCHLLRPFKTS